MSFSTSFDLTAFGTLSRSELVYLARLAESSERYDDMCAIMSRLVSQFGTLSLEERNLLSVAFKNVVGARRSSWRQLQGDADASAPEQSRLSSQFKKAVEGELENLCKQVLDLLEKQLLTATGLDAESQVFYLKMAGDYYRYLSEFKPKAADAPADPSTHEGKAAQNYSKAMDLATEHLPSTHPIRLGLALNYSVCHYEILHDPTAACNLARSAFDEAIKKLDTLDESSYKDSTLILQLLRDNLTLWQSGENQQ